MRALPLILAGTALMALFSGCIDDTTTDVQDQVLPAYTVPAVPTIDAADLLADHAQFVAANNERAQNLPTHESARADLAAHFASYGLEVFRQNFTNGIPQANIVGIKWGEVRDQWVVVGAHYDTITDDCIATSVLTGDNDVCPLRSLSQGAYDDGSGTMMVVHLAKAWANVTPYYTIAFVAFDGEERGTQGAAAFVQDFALEPKTPYGAITIVGDVDLDMLGLNWPGVNAPMNVLTNSEKAYDIVDAKRTEMQWPDEQFVRKDGLMLGSSDYARFWEVDEDAGHPAIPTIFFISDFEEVGAPAPAPSSAYTPAGAYPFWHLQDTVETMALMAGGQGNLELGFQAAGDLAATILHAMATQPQGTFDAVPQ